MPIEKVLWTCTICHTDYVDKESAEACEARGAGQDYPIGMLWTFNAHYTFAVAGRRSNPHRPDVALHYQAGHSSGRQDESLPVSGTCSSVSMALLVPPRPDSPTFKRMVDALDLAGIPVTCWDGTRAVPLVDFLARPRVNHATAKDKGAVEDQD